MLVFLGGSALAGLVLLQLARVAAQLVLDEALRQAQYAAGGFGGYVAGAVAALLVRDRWLIRNIRSWIERADCGQCGYTLLGLKQADGLVTCPECGTRNDLTSRGVEMSTLAVLEEPSA